MPRYRTQVAHSLGQSEAVERLKANTEKAREFSDLSGSWSGNTFAFAASVQGIKLKGTLQVEEDSLQFDGHLPLVAMPFVSWFPRILKKALESNLNLKEKSAEANTTKINARDDAQEESATAAPVVLFLHLPKAGGTTLGEFIYNQCHTEEKHDEGLLKDGVLFLPYGFFKESDLSVPEFVRPLLRRENLRAVIGHFWYGIHEHMGVPSTYVTVLRDPVERVVSLYHYLKLENEMSLEEFVSTPPYKEVDNDQTRRIAGVDPEIGGCTMAILRAAQENLRRDFSVVGVTERFDETLVLLKRKLKWERKILSYPRNTNVARPSTDSLTQEVMNAVRERNELDFKLWQYADQLLDEAIAAEGKEFGEELEKYKSLRPAPPPLSVARSR